MAINVDFKADTKNLSAEMPRHVAIIMDGNGRWAKSRGLPRTEGHRQGVKTVRNTVRLAHGLGIEYLTLFSFSSENWNRPASEVEFILGLLKRYIETDLEDLYRQNVRIQVIGSRSDLASGLRKLLTKAETRTQNCSGLTLVIAFNYGARDELARAVTKLAHDVAAGDLLPKDITSDRIEGYLDTSTVPDPDLIIRTSGEQRLSNFLLWQAAYSEFFFSPVHWPDFDDKAFEQAIYAFQNRDRRYGGLSAKAAQ
ncbi:isoprenyl transferase [Flexibacterium corallicola]|uniref:isoprenyl transferase n=1 Tax=Flexibacterium corallicola TaxID=3037259 RepID=UPI00286F04F1|nr:isoprenyl transferase [Pseudovibrio sp. M1P-2-3]